MYQLSRASSRYFRPSIIPAWNFIFNLLCAFSQDPKIPNSEKKKKVVFHPTAFVVLIPTAEEYHRAGLGTALWWAENDYRIFKQCAMEEIREFVQKFPRATCAEILKKYYETLLSESGDEDDPNYPRSPNSVAELAQCMSSSEDANTTICTNDGPSSSPRKAAIGHIIERTDSVQMYRNHHSDEDFQALSIEPELRASEDAGDISPKINEPPPTTSGGLVGLVPIIANAAAMIVLSFVQGE